MSNLYQSTTESLESLDNWPTCAPPLPCKKRRGMDNRGVGTQNDVELDEVSTRQNRNREGDESKESCKYAFVNSFSFRFSVS